MFDHDVVSDIVERGVSSAGTRESSGASDGMTTMTSSARRSFSRISLAISIDESSLDSDISDELAPPALLWLP